MRILMYSDVFGGPTTTFIYNDLIGLSKKNEVKYVATQKISSDSFRYENVDVVEYDVLKVYKKILFILETSGRYLNFFNRPFSQKVNKIISDFKPDIIQCNFGYEALRLTDNLNYEHSKIPIVINFLGYDASFHLNRSSYVQKLKDISKKKNVFATSNTAFLKKNLEAKDIFFQENRVIHTGVRLDFFDRQGFYPKPTNDFIFLHIATLARRKGQELTLHAFKKLLEVYKGDKKLKLILAGGKEDDYGDLIRALPETLGIKDHVQLFDWISPLQQKELMIHANCFVHPSHTVYGRTEGIPTVVSESMAMELPVISTWHAGIPELVEDGVNGYLIEENDVYAYLRRMLNIMSWTYLKINREKVMREFNIEKRIESFENYYKNILSKK